MIHDIISCSTTSIELLTCASAIFLIDESSAANIYNNRLRSRANFNSHSYD